MKSARLLSTTPAAQPVMADDVLEFHAARLLLLLKHCGISNRIDGLTKLAKLDFFVRYPQFFAAISAKLGKSAPPPKRDIESTMVRFHYGPWDKRYYHVLAYLEAKRLVEVENNGTAYVFRLTDGGRDVAGELTKSAAFNTLVAQMKAVKDLLGKRAGSTLKDLIYENFESEVAALSLDEVID